MSDDSSFLDAKNLAHISSIFFYYDRYIYGFVVNYNSNGRTRSQRHLPNKYSNAIIHKVHFDRGEYIVEISATWSKNALHSVSGRTNYGNRFSAECFEGYGIYSNSQKIYSKNGEVVCGLKTLIDEHLQGLYAISATLPEGSINIMRENFTNNTVHDTESDNDSASDSNSNEDEKEEEEESAPTKVRREESSDGLSTHYSKRDNF